MDDGSFAHDAFVLQLLEKPAEHLVHGDQTGVVVFCDLLERSSPVCIVPSSDLVFRFDEALRFAGPAPEIVVKCRGLWNCHAVVKIEVTSFAIIRGMRGLRPEKKAKRLL